LVLILKFACASILADLPRFSGYKLLTMKRKKKPWELVAFTTTETGDNLIVSFAVCQPGGQN
jgi:hypothetical protein